MKFNIVNNISLLLFVLLFSCSFKTYSQVLAPSNDAGSVGVVFSTLKIDYATFQNIENKLKSLKKIEYLGYCTNHDVFIVKSSSNIFSNSDDLFNFVINKFDKSDLFIKKEGTIEDIIGFCDFNGFNSNEAAEQKKELLRN